MEYLLIKKQQNKHLRKFSSVCIVFDVFEIFEESLQKVINYESDLNSIRSIKKESILYLTN